LSGGIITAGFLLSPRLMYGLPDGHSALFVSWSSQLFSVARPKVLPSFQTFTPSPVALRCTWSLLLLWVILLPWLAPVAARLLEAGDEVGGPASDCHE
jgi:hypothetical protein